MKHCLKHLSLPLTIVVFVLSILSVISFINSCSDSSSDQDSSFLTQPCSQTWDQRYSMLSLDLSWISSNVNLAEEDHQVSNNVSYTVSSKDTDTIVLTNNSSSFPTTESKTNFEQVCERNKTLFNRDNSTVYDQSRTVSGKTYNCKYLTTTLSKEEAAQITSNSELTSQATSSIIYHSYVTSKEMFTLYEELLFEINGTKYVMRKDITSIN